MASEIERTFLLSDVPELADGDRWDAIEQGYLALDGETEVRVRRKGDATVLTVKHGEGRRRVEEEVAISAESFDALWPLTQGRRVEKRRHAVALGELTLEVDVFGRELEGLVLAEVEFSDDDGASSFEPPGWLGEEVTGDSRYSNRRLAIEGRPRGHSL